LSPRDGRFIERVGYYNPMAAGPEEKLQIDLGRVEHWVARGARLSERVAQLVRRYRKAQGAAEAA